MSTDRRTVPQDVRWQRGGNENRETRWPTYSLWETRPSEKGIYSQNGTWVCGNRDHEGGKGSTNQCAGETGGGCLRWDLIKEGGIKGVGNRLEKEGSSDQEGC